MFRYWENKAKTSTTQLNQWKNAAITKHKTQVLLQVNAYYKWIIEVRKINWTLKNKNEISEYIKLTNIWFFWYIYYFSCFICKHTMKLPKTRHKKFVLFLCKFHFLHCKVVMWLRLLNVFLVINFQIHFFWFEMRFYYPAVCNAWSHQCT